MYPANTEQLVQPVTLAYKEYTLTTDRALLQPNAIHEWLTTESYWAKGIPYDLVKTSFDHSFVFGALYEQQQVAYGQLIADYATFGYLADVYVLEPHRGRGLSKQMMQLMMAQPWVKGLRRLMLATLDAGGLYEQFGFTAPVFPQRLMEITRPKIYETRAEDAVAATPVSPKP